MIYTLHQVLADELNENHSRITWKEKHPGIAMVVPKSYRPKGQRRSTRNELPIRADFGNSRKHPIWRLKRGEN